MERTPARIVSLVPSTTESVCVLGAAGRLVACTRYCTEPAHALTHVRRIGGTKNPSLDAILALAPDLVLANAEENRAEDIEWLQERMPVLVQTPRTVSSAVDDLRALAARLGVDAAARTVVDRIDAELAAPAAWPRGTAPPRVYYAIWRRPWMSVNRDTFVHDVLCRSGAHNVCADEAPRYPEVEPQVAVARSVDVVLLANEPWEFDAAQQREVQAAGLFGTARIVLCNGRDFCWHGTHMTTGLPRARALLRSLSR